MRTLTVLLLSLALPLICPAAAIDPIGDTYGTGLQFDIASVSAYTTGTSTTFDIRFAAPVPADLNAHLWGAIEIDRDRDPNTGKTSELDYPNMNFPHGVDYVIGFFYDDDPGTAAILDVTSGDFFSLPAEYGADYVRITVPIAGLKGDSRVHYAVGVGDGQNMASLYSDLAGNDYGLLTSETPEPGTWALGGVALGLFGLARKRRRC
ncbi:MAG TPA: PEP-CTERM sorting domain-containing protein [Bryobacteraceae bacterium]|nr:PEP-CTERM sorting domain-containing protein [Bryobacteraceae bacterium]